MLMVLYGISMSSRLSPLPTVFLSYTRAESLPLLQLLIPFASVKEGKEQGTDKKLQ